MLHRSKKPSRAEGTPSGPREKANTAWDLEDLSFFVALPRISLTEAVTYGGSTTGQRDRDRRERVRQAAQALWPPTLPVAQWWAFRIFVTKNGNRPFDVDNVPKLIIDAFSQKQIQADKSSYPSVGLFEDDSIDHVRLVQVYGERTAGPDETKISIFGRRG